MKEVLKAAFLLLALGCIFFYPQPSSAAESVDPKISASVRKIQGLLPSLRFTSDDLLNPPRWETPHALPEVEKLLEDPTSAALKVAGWNGSLQKDHSPSALAAFLRKMLAPAGAEDARPAESAAKYPELDKLPPDLRGPITAILKAIHQASPMIEQSFNGLSASERDAILDYYDISVPGYKSSGILTPRKRKEIFKSLRQYDQADLVNASAVVFETLQDQIPLLMALSESVSTQSFRGALPIKFKTAVGDVQIFGAGDDTIDLASLDVTALYVKLGGMSRYQGGTSDTRSGRIRVGLDFSRDVVLKSTAPSAGSGIFGIDLLFLPAGGGTKTIETGSYSQGFGLCGIGGLFVNGSGNYSARRYAQGAGAFGAGFFINNDGDGSTYQTQLYGQGVGFTRGIGMFIHRGDSAELRAGLVDPDPREPLGATSLSQGVGCGPRAYAGGGIGFCLLKGDNVRVESSYFAQGAGYWHAAGSFVLDGSSCTVKARRYDQGSGVHSAFGMFTLSGSDNRVINWGVGPAFGWDASVGWAFVLGDRNAVQTEWSAGSASLGASRSFSVFSGNQNRIDLPGLAGGQFIRDLSDLSIAWIDGAGNRLKSGQVKGPRVFTGPLYTSPWGLISGASVTIVNDVGLGKESWQRLPPEGLPEESQVNLETELLAADALSVRERVERLILVAAAFSVDKAQPRRARGKLISLKPAELGYLLDGIEFTDVDGFIQRRVIAALWGDPLLALVPDAVKKESDPQRRALLLSLLPLARSGTAAPVLLRSLNDPDWRVQSTAIRALGVLLNQNQANISGRLHVLKAFEKMLASPSGGKARTEFLKELLAQPYAEALGILSAAGNWSALERATLLESAPEDVTSSLNSEPAERILQMIDSIRADALKSVRGELLDSEKMRSLAAQNLAAFLARIKPKGREIRIDPTVEALTYDLLTALGKLGQADSVYKIEPYLDYPGGKIREGAAVALARIGSPAKKALEARAASWDSEQKMNAVAAVTETADKSLLKILEMGLVDDNQDVRQAAMSAVEKLQRPLEAEKVKLKERIRNASEGKSGDTMDAQKIFLFGER